MIKIFLVSLGATSMAIVSAISRYSLSRGAGSFQTVEMFGNLTDAICPGISDGKIGRDWYSSIEAIASAISQYFLSRGAGAFQTAERLLGNLVDAICPGISDGKSGRNCAQFSGWYIFIASAVG